MQEKERRMLEIKKVIQALLRGGDNKTGSGTWVKLFSLATARKILSRCSVIKKSDPNHQSIVLDKLPTSHYSRNELKVKLLRA